MMFWGCFLSLEFKKPLPRISLIGANSQKQSAKIRVIGGKKNDETREVKTNFKLKVIMGEVKKCIISTSRKHGNRFASVVRLKSD
jgi:hypothetical protein